MALDPQILAEYNATREPSDVHLFCHAPFTSLNFEQNGNVSACCYNRTAVLGTYPDKTIDEIWNGEAAREFRRQMQSGSPPKGCEICVNQLTNRNFEGLKARFYDGLLKGPPQPDWSAPPGVMEFEISNTCNLECIMCSGYYSSSIRKNRERLPPLPNPYDDDFVTQLEPYLPHLKEARFLGGEPFLVKTYRRIWERIASVNPKIRVSITTNGTVLTPSMKDMLERMEANIILSLDSLDPKNYESIRVNASFSEVMTHLEYFEEYVKRKGTDITIALCVMQQNWHELPDYVDFCSNRGFRLYCNTVLSPSHTTLTSLSSHELDGILRSLRGKLDESRAQEECSLVYEGMLGQITNYRDASTLWESLVSRADAEYERIVGTRPPDRHVGEFNEDNRSAAARLVGMIVRAFLHHKMWRETLAAPPEGLSYHAIPRQVGAWEIDDINAAMDELYRSTSRFEGFETMYGQLLKAAATVLRLVPPDAVDGESESVVGRIEVMIEMVTHHQNRTAIMMDARNSGTSLVLAYVQEHSVTEQRDTTFRKYGAITG